GGDGPLRRRRRPAGSRPPPPAAAAQAGHRRRAELERAGPAVPPLPAGHVAAPQGAQGGRPRERAGRRQHPALPHAGRPHGRGAQAPRRLLGRPAGGAPAPRGAAVIDGEKVVHELVLAAPPDDVFDAFVDPVRLVAWIGITADLEPRPGGRFRFEIAPGEFCEGEYVTVERPRHLVFTWGWTAPSFELPPGSSRVEVTLRPVDDGM